MASITIRNLDDTLKRRLRVRAAEHGRSMEEEAREILREVVGNGAPPRDLAAAIRKRVAPLGGVDLDIPERELIREPVRFDRSVGPMILLDTNVASELPRKTPEPKVEAWLAAQDGADVHLSAVTEAELRLGVAVRPGGRRRTALAGVMGGILPEDFRGRILPFDSPAAAAYAAIAADRRAAGRPISQFDCQIAAIAWSNGAAVATRNIRDFEGCGIETIDPWQG